MKRLFRSRHGIRSDEEVLLFPAVARLSPDGSEWIIPLRGWLFEPERNSLWRALIIEWTRRRLRLHRDVIRSDLFAARSRMFLVDNERGRQLHLHLAGTDKGARHAFLRQAPANFLGPRPATVVQLVHGLQQRR